VGRLRGAGGERGVGMRMFTPLFAACGGVWRTLYTLTFSYLCKMTFNNQRVIDLWRRDTLTQSYLETTSRYINVRIRCHAATRLGSG
jgi:hypothetical protein